MAATEIHKLKGKFSSSWRRAAAWSAIAVYLGLVVGFAWSATPFAQALAAIGVVSAFVHAAFAYGRKDALVFFVICVVVTFTVENIGAATGLPFGHYHFEVGAELPRVGAIPIIVGPLWFGMGYFSWVVAGILLGGADRRPDSPLGVVARPIVAAFVMTQWDLVMDPPAATIAKAWIWHDGGADFGVPLSNYLGWLLTSFLFYQAFAFYLRTRRAASPPPAQTSRAFRFAAVLFYASSGLTHLTPWLLGQTGEIADASGHVWRVHDLRETTVVVMLFTMVFTSMLAGLRLFGEDLRGAE